MFKKIYFKVRLFYRKYKAKIIAFSFILLLGMLTYTTYQKSEITESYHETLNDLDIAKRNLSQMEANQKLQTKELLAERESRNILYEKMMALKDTNATLETQFALEYDRYQESRRELTRMELNYDALLELTEEKRNEILNARCDAKPFNDDFMRIINNRLQQQTKGRIHNSE